MSKTYSIDEIKSKSRTVFMRNDVIKAYLFGSYANGNTHGGSDIDIALETGNIPFLRVCGIMEELSQILAKKVDVFDFREIEKDSNIFKEIIGKGILLYEAKEP